MFHCRQRQRVLDFIQEGKKEARLVRGGDLIEGRGCYIRPAIFVDPSPDAKVLTQELFGPVVVIYKFKDEDEVIRMANNTEYGLAAYICTKDIGKALRTSSRCEAGLIGVRF